MEKCKNCRFFEDGICRVPLYADGILYPGSGKDADDGCYLFDPEGEDPREER